MILVAAIIVYMAATVFERNYDKQFIEPCIRYDEYDRYYKK